MIPNSYDEWVGYVASMPGPFLKFPRAQRDEVLASLDELRRETNGLPKMTGDQYLFGRRVVFVPALQHGGVLPRSDEPVRLHPGETITPVEELS